MRQNSMENGVKFFCTWEEYQRNHGSIWMQAIFFEISLAIALDLVLIPVEYGRTNPLKFKTVTVVAYTCIQHSENFLRGQRYMKISSQSGPAMQLNWTANENFLQNIFGCSCNLFPLIQRLMSDVLFPINQSSWGMKWGNAIGMWKIISGRQ